MCEYYYGIKIQNNSRFLFAMSREIFRIFEKKKYGKLNYT